MMEYETFYDKIKADANEIHRLTIPMKLIKFAGLKVGDQVKVMIQKIPQEVKNEKDTN